MPPCVCLNQARCEGEQGQAPDRRSPSPWRRGGVEERKGITGLVPRALNIPKGVVAESPSSGSERLHTEDRRETKGQREGRPPWPRYPVLHLRPSLPPIRTSPALPEGHSPPCRGAARQLALYCSWPSLASLWWSCPTALAPHLGIFAADIRRLPALLTSPTTPHRYTTIRPAQARGAKAANPAQ